MHASSRVETGTLWQPHEIANEDPSSSKHRRLDSTVPVRSRDLREKKSLTIKTVVGLEHTTSLELPWKDKIIVVQLMETVRLSYQPINYITSSVNLCSSSTTPGFVFVA